MEHDHLSDILPQYNPVGLTLDVYLRALAMKRMKRNMRTEKNLDCNTYLTSNKISHIHLADGKKTQGQIFS